MRQDTHGVRRSTYRLLSTVDRVWSISICSHDGYTTVDIAVHSDRCIRDPANRQCHRDVRKKEFVRMDVSYVGFEQLVQCFPPIDSRPHIGDTWTCMIWSSIAICHHTAPCI